jgi:integrase
MRFPQPFFRAPRNLWYVQIGKKQFNLGPDKEAAFAEYHRLMSRPQLEIDPNLVVSILDAFLTWEKGQRAKATYEGHRWHIQRFIDAVPGIATLSVSDFRPYHLKNWVDGFVGVGDTHRRNAIRSVKRAFSWAIEYGYIEKNPIAGVRCPSPGRRDKLITPETFAKILGKVRDQRFRDLLTFAWETGARPQEVKRIEVRHFEAQLARIRFPKEESKGKKRARIIYLTDTALEIVKRMVDQQQSEIIFRNRRGQPWTSYAINCRLCRIAKKIGEKFALYDFRHSFAHRMLVSGMDSLTLSELMGHEDLTMLKKVYGHLEKGNGFLLDRLKKASSPGSAAPAV